MINLCLCPYFLATHSFQIISFMFSGSLLSLHHCTPIPICDLEIKYLSRPLRQFFNIYRIHLQIPLAFFIDCSLLIWFLQVILGFPTVSHLESKLELLLLLCSLDIVSQFLDVHLCQPVFRVVNSHLASVNLLFKEWDRLYESWFLHFFLINCIITIVHLKEGIKE